MAHGVRDATLRVENGSGRLQLVRRAAHPPSNPPACGRRRNYKSYARHNLIDIGRAPPSISQSVDLKGFADVSRPFDLSPDKSRIF